MNARTRKAYDTDKFTGYEIVLDVFPDVFAYGILLLPKELKADDKRPVVVCQHGLEGRPQETVTGDSKFYHDFAAKLCERGRALELDQQETRSPQSGGIPRG